MLLHPERKTVGRMRASLLALIVSILLASTEVILGQTGSLPTLPSASELAKMGNENFAKRDFETAFKNYSGCLLRDPKAAHCAYNMGLVRKTQGKYAEAAEHYTNAIRINSTYAKAFAGRADVHRLDLKYQPCIDDYSKAISLGDKDERSYSGRASCYRSLGRYEQAIGDLSSAIAITPRVDYLNDRAFSYYSLKRYADAFADLERTKNQPSNQFTRIMRADAAAAAGKNEAAIEYYLIAIQNEPALKPDQPLGASAIPSLYYRQGQVYEKLGKFQLAHDAYNASLSLLRDATVIRARDAVKARIPASKTTARTGTPKPQSFLDQVNEQLKPAKPAAAGISTAQPPASPIEGLAKVDAAEGKGDHAAVISIASQSLKLIRMRAELEPADELMTTIFIAHLRSRARAYAMTGKIDLAVDDYTAASNAALKGMLRHMQQSNMHLSAAKISSVSALAAKKETDLGTLVCRSGEPVALEFVDKLKEKGADMTDSLKAGIMLVAVREMCSNVLTMSGGNTHTMSIANGSRRQQYLDQSVAAYTEALKYLSKNKAALLDRAKVYRELGKIDLAIADERAAAQLATQK